MDRKFLTNTLKLGSSTGASQVLQLLLLPALLRIYGVEAFGVFSIILAISQLFGPVIALRYDQAVVTEKNDSLALQLFYGCLALCLVFFIVLSSIFVWQSQNIASLLSMSRLSGLMLLAGILLLFEGLQCVCRAWLTRTNRFGTLAKSQLLKVVSIYAIQFYFGLNGDVSAHALTLGAAAGMAITSIYLLLLSILETRTIQKVDFQLIETLKRHRNFPLYNTWGSFVNFASIQLPTLLLSRYFSADIVGYYSLAQKTLRAPLGFLGNAISQVYFRESSLKRESPDLKHITLSIYKGLFYVGLPLFLICINGKEIYSVLFGVSWTQTHLYSAILAPLFFVWLISSPVSVLYAVFDKQRELLGFQVIKFSLRLGALVIGGVSGDITLTLVLLTVFVGLPQLIQGIYSYRLSHFALHDFLSVFSNQKINLAVIILFCLSTALGFLPNAVVAFGTLAFSGAYFLWLIKFYITKNNFRANGESL